MAYVVLLGVVILLSAFLSGGNMNIYLKIIIVSIASPAIMTGIGMVKDGYVDPFFEISYGVQFLICLVVSSIAISVMSRENWNQI